MLKSLRSLRLVCLGKPLPLFRTMIALIRPILFTFLGSTQVKRLIIDLLRKLSESTDNTIDDKAVEFIENGLFPKQ